MGSGVPGGTHPNFKNMGSGGFRVPCQNPEKWIPGELGKTGFGHKIVKRSKISLDPISNGKRYIPRSSHIFFASDCIMELPRNSYFFP